MAHHRRSHLACGTEVTVTALCAGGAQRPLRSSFTYLTLTFRLHSSLLGLPVCFRTSLSFYLWKIPCPPRPLKLSLARRATPPLKEAPIARAREPLGGVLAKPCACGWSSIARGGGGAESGQDGHRAHRVFFNQWVSDGDRRSFIPVTRMV